MSVQALIKRFGQPITIQRDTNVESRLKGKRVEDIRKSFVITASVQPFDPDETVEESPGSERNRHGIRLYSVEELKVVDVEGQFKADWVEYDGEVFEVIRVSKWVRNNRTLQHYKSIAFKLNEQERN